MAHAHAIRTSTRAAHAASLLACCLLLPLLTHGALAQDDGAKGTLRERIRQRWIAAQQRKPAPKSDADTSSRIEQPGDYTFSLVHDGLTRMYQVHVPKSYSAAKPVPLLMAFHGGGGDMEHQASDANYGLVSKSESAGFVAVFPNGYSKLPSGKFATWNAGNCCADARDHRVDDVGFVREIIARLGQQLNVDRQRIYATGMSNGAMMAYRLACEMADTFKAIAAVAGTDNTAQCAPSAPVAVLHIHARNDDHVLYNGGAGRKFGDLSKVTDYVSVPATVSKWVGLNHCSPQPRRSLTTAGAYCDSYSPCQGNAVVELCVTETGGHSWPGGTKLRGAEPASQAISANDVMWAFFTRAADRHGASQ